MFQKAVLPVFVALSLVACTNEENNQSIGDDYDRAYEIARKLGAPVDFATRLEERYRTDPEPKSLWMARIGSTGEMAYGVAHSADTLEIAISGGETECKLSSEGHPCFQVMVNDRLVADMDDF